MKLKVYTQDGKQTGTIDVSDEIFGGEINTGLLHQIVKSYMANKRQGTAKTKSRTEVSGGGKKPWKQKGTGRARAGSNTSPIWVRGGKAHGATPRDYGETIPKTLRRLALRQALTSRMQDDKIVVVDPMKCDAPKTKTLTGMLKALKIESGRTLLLTDGSNRNMYLSGRNIPDLKVAPVSSLNAFDVLHNHNIILTAKGMVGKLEEAVKL
jgi:large subunit ribosomal protein L4